MSEELVSCAVRPTEGEAIGMARAPVREVTPMSAAIAPAARKLIDFVDIKISISFALG